MYYTVPVPVREFAIFLWIPAADSSEFRGTIRTAPPVQSPNGAPRFSAIVSVASCQRQEPVGAGDRSFLHSERSRNQTRAIRCAELSAARTLRIADPFCGDGRLLIWLMEALLECGYPKKSRIEITGWDIDDAACRKARETLAAFVEERGLKATIQIEATDTFAVSAQHSASFDCVITNPPWEALKPDRRELDALDERTGEESSPTCSLRSELADAFPLSQPSRKFSGWGTNFRELGLRLRPD